MSTHDFRICQKALTQLLPGSVKLHHEASAHEQFLEPATANQLAVYMRPEDSLLAATDQVRHTCRRYDVHCGLSVLPFTFVTAHTHSCKVKSAEQECLPADMDTAYFRLHKMMQDNSLLHAITETWWLQGLLVVYKAQHGVRQGIINVNLSTASLQLEEAGLKGVQNHAVNELSGAFAVLAKPQRSLLPFKRNVVHPGKQSKTMS